MRLRFIVKILAEKEVQVEPIALNRQSIVAIQWITIGLKTDRNSKQKKKYLSHILSTVKYIEFP